MLNHPNISPWPFFEADEVEAATQTLRSGKVNYWTGEQGKLFESTYAKFTQKPYGIALANGTLALELALRSLGIQSGDEVIVASRSYVASASCVLLVGARPVFADIDEASGNITAETIAPCITSKTKAIIPVHVGGWPCDMTAIMQLAKKHDLKVIEDCAQAHGARWQGKPVGAFGDAAIFSFCQDKIISTGGEGGMLLLQDEQAYKAAWAFKDIGRSYDAVYHQQHAEGFRWLTETAGSNFRMTEFQAAIGLKQLEKLPRWTQLRIQHAQIITQALKQFDFIEVPHFELSDSHQHAFYRLYAKTKPSTIIAGKQGIEARNHLISALEKAGVPCFYGSCAEVYREKVFKNQSPSLTSLPNAANWHAHGFCFLVHHTITEEQLKKMASTIELTLSELEVTKKISFKAEPNY